MSEQEVKELPTETKEKVAVETKVEDTKASSKGDDAAQEATNADTSTTESVKRKDPIEATGEPKKKKKRRTYDDEDEPEKRNEEDEAGVNKEGDEEDEEVDADAEEQEEGDDDDDDDEDEYEGEDDGEDEEEEEDELNEIDTTNIITTGRRTRGKQIDFKDAAAKLDSEEAKK